MLAETAVASYYRMVVKGVRFEDVANPAKYGVKTMGSVGGRDRFSYRGKCIYPGDWIVALPDDSFEVIADEEFRLMYQPHACGVDGSDTVVTETCVAQNTTELERV